MLATLTALSWEDLVIESMELGSGLDRDGCILFAELVTYIQGHSIPNGTYCNGQSNQLPSAPDAFVPPDSFDGMLPFDRGTT